MSTYVLGFQAIDKSQRMAVGGKGANLGELVRIAGLRVPDGFCITTGAFKRILADTPSINALLDQLSLCTLEDRNRIAELSAAIRRLIAAAAIPHDLRAEIARVLAELGEQDAYAVRSSATAEDLPTASFAGQQDTYLNIIGKEAILRHVSLCWASSFSERAVTYRLQNGFDHRKVLLAVVVQKMVFPQAAGILFTADPITSNRKVLSIDAGFGLGEALVSGLVNADNYKVRDEQVIARRISAKKLAVYARPGGGTQAQALDPEQQNRQTLTDAQILQLARIGRKIEGHFGRPQDIEWCLVDDTFSIVQSRPITTLYPIPVRDDQENHVYVSVGHQQMMTDAFKPLGVSIRQLTAGRGMYEAGGRLFVDVAPDLASPAQRDILVNVLGKSDPLIQDALRTILERGDFVASAPDSQPEAAGASDQAPPAPNYQILSNYEPAVVLELIEQSETEIAELKHNIQAVSGSELFDFILEDLQQLRKSLSNPRSFGVFMTAMNASSWLNEKMNAWLGETNAADVLSQSLPNNVTAEMGLALMDVADVIRPYPQVIEFLQHARDDHFWADLEKCDGGQQVGDALAAFLDKYGMRCAGEIDITRTRWSESPTTLVPTLLGNIRSFDPGAGKRRFEQKYAEALEKEEDLLRRLRQLPDGEQKARETKRMIDLLRNLMGYREYPKYALVSRYFVYKQALLKEAERLVRAGVIREKEDIYYLTFNELHEVVITHQLDYVLINGRKEEYAFYATLTPPRVLTSDGEIIAGAYKRANLPPSALVGLAVSSGVVEGRARVILNMADADLADGDILVTTFTDPSWTPVFVSVKGLVTEVGGLMTHGAVIAREYGLPAVIGAEDATKRIRSGERIRVNGTEGYVEIL